MRILREGQRRRAICPNCEGIVEIRYEYRTIHLEESDLDVENVLVGVCEECDEVVSIPAQSTPKLKQARARKEESLEARVPQHLDDIVYIIADRLDVSAKHLRSALLRYYFNEVRLNKATARRVFRLACSDLARGKQDARISLRIAPELHTATWCAATEAGFRTRADLVRGILLAAKEDVLEGRAKSRRKELERIAAAI